MTKFAKIKFVRKPASSHDKVCVEGQAWDEITSVRAMANPDYRELGEGDTLEEAKKAASSALQDAHYRFMTHQ